MNLDNVLVVNFAVNERTLALSEYCFKKLHFKNFITIKGDDGFKDKFLQFARIACNSEYNYFIRTDADRLLFDGVYDLLPESENDDSFLCSSIVTGKL